MKELGKFLSALNEFRHRIFNSESATFQTIMASLDKTNKFGDVREVNAVVNLKKIFGTDSVKKAGALGDKADMIDGVDATVELDNTLKTIQIKPFNGYETNEGIITVFGTGNVKPYTTNYLAFHDDKKGTIVFKNNDTKIINGRFTFPVDSFINP